MKHEHCHACGKLIKGIVHDKYKPNTLVKRECYCYNCWISLGKVEPISIAKIIKK